MHPNCAANLSNVDIEESQGLFSTLCSPNLDLANDEAWGDFVSASDIPPLELGPSHIESEKFHAIYQSSNNDGRSSKAPSKVFLIFRALLTIPEEDWQDRSPESIEIYYESFENHDGSFKDYCLSNPRLQTKSHSFSKDLEMILRILGSWIRDSNIDGASFSQTEDSLILSLFEMVASVDQWWKKLREDKRIESAVRQHVIAHRARIPGK